MRDALLDIPERYRAGLELYARRHIAPGSFLRLLLEDVKTNEAIARMDRDVTLEQLRTLLGFIHSELMPGTCHGSPERVADWIAQGAAHRNGERACFHCERASPWYESQPAEGSAAR